MDLLAHVLSTLRLRGTAYFNGRFHAPWGMHISTKDVANFHVVVEDGCVLRWEEAGTQRQETLCAGDIVVFPHGDPHALSDDVASETPPATQLLSTRRAGEQGTAEFGKAEGGKVAGLICGHFEVDRAGQHPLLQALPIMVLLRKCEGPDPVWVETATRLAVLESESGRPGSSAVVDRLAEALMIQVVRAHAARSDQSGGFLVALGDPSLAAALAAIHEEPARAWSVEALAQHAGASRSAFAARFRQVLEMGPIQYLTQWRMHLARQLMADPQLSLAQVAERVGYTSEFAFAKAFKRVIGEAPGASRRSA